MIIKNIIKNILPYFIVQWNRKRHSFKTFAEGFKQSGYQSDCEIEDNKSFFDFIVSVQGFGYSGSGAVIDLLREFSCVKVLAYVDNKDEGGGFVPDYMKMSEIDFVRLSGGLFEIEKYLDSDNIFINDALLNRTAKLFGQASLYRYNDVVKDLMYRFFAKITSAKIENLQQVYYNAHTISDVSIPDIYFLKKMSRNEYIDLCKCFLTSIFNIFADSDSKILVCDQLLSDTENKIERNLEYIPNLKTIIVVRDPRDTYIWSVKKNIEWIAHDTVYKYIEWYKTVYRNVKLDKLYDNCLIIRYENLVLDYDREVYRIHEYLNLPKQSHSLKKQYFRPSYSQRFVGLYKEAHEFAMEIKIIQDHLSEYCNSLI